MTKGLPQWDAKDRAMGLYWVTARQVVWRVQTHEACCGNPEHHKHGTAKKESSQRK